MLHAFKLWIADNNNLVIVGVFSEYIANKVVDEVLLPLRSQICDYYARNIISAKTCPSDFELNAFNSFLGKLSSDEWEQYFLLPLIKLLKKSPESASRLVSHILTYVRIDVSRLVKEAGYQPFCSHPEF
jgi:hypothetical protein